MLSDFYKPRWEIFISYLKEKLEEGDPKEPDYYAFEKAWTEQTKPYPFKPISNTLKQAERIYNKYHDKIKGTNNNKK